MQEEQHPSSHGKDAGESEEVHVEFEDAGASMEQHGNTNGALRSVATSAQRTMRYAGARCSPVIVVTLPFSRG